MIVGMVAECTRPSEMTSELNCAGEGGSRLVTVRTRASAACKPPTSRMLPGAEVMSLFCPGKWRDDGQIRDVHRGVRPRETVTLLELNFSSHRRRASSSE